MQSGPTRPNEATSLPRVELVFDDACPNLKQTRANLLRAFARVGAPASWTEVRIGSPEAPAHTRGFGSPTILVDGLDVAGLPPGAETCCRVYDTGRAPSVDVIAAALLPRRP